MKKNIREYIELSAYNRAIDHLKDRGITASIREDKKIVVEQQDYERAITTLGKAFNWGELTIQPTVTTLKEHYDLESIVKRFPKEIKDWEDNQGLSTDLFHALYDYYFDEMPYGTKKARDGDPEEWISDRLSRDIEDVRPSHEGQGDLFDESGAGLEEGNGAHMFVMGDTVYWNNREGKVDRQEGNKVFVHTKGGDMDVWPADETSLTRQGMLPTMRKHINDIGRGLKGFMTGRPELEEASKDEDGFSFPEGGPLGYKLGTDNPVTYGMGHRSEGITITNKETGETVHYNDFTYFDEEPTQEDLQMLLDDDIQESKVEEKAKNPYAVGMAQAMKSTGDKPPLKKSTIKKAHEIAKKVDAKESIDTIKRLAGLQRK